MLLSNKSLIMLACDNEVNYRQKDLLEDKDVAFLIKYFKERFNLNESDTICELYFNY